jgi:hypothetical protein
MTYPETVLSTETEFGPIRREMVALSGCHPRNQYGEWLTQIQSGLPDFQIAAAVPSQTACNL